MDHKKRIRTMSWVLAAGFVIMLLKFAGWWLTGSNAILSDAVESIVNVAAGSFALWSLYYAAQPRDQDHPYGHGKIEFVSSGIEGGMITLAGLAMIARAIYSFFFPAPLQHLDAGVLITVVSGLANFILGRILLRAGKAAHSAVMQADGRHLLTDTYSSLGLLVGLLVIWLTGLNWLDGVVTILLAVFIIYTGVSLIREALFGLLDTADIRRISKVLVHLNRNRRESWIDIHNLRVLQYGAVLHVDCHMTIPWYFTLEEAHNEVDAVSRLAESSIGQEIEFFIHADPCLPKSCSICVMSQCAVREQPLAARLEWTLENVLPDRKHTAQQG